MLVLVLLCSVGMAICTPTPVEPIGGFGYHDRVGIPLATRIREVEDKAFAERKPDHEDIRAAGSAIVSITKHPYMAGLIATFANTPRRSVCGSSLLSANRLVTAAHCWTDGVKQAKQFTVVLGSNRLFQGGTRIRTDIVFTHPLWKAYDEISLRNDIAMIYLPYSIKFSSTIQPISIPKGRDVNNQFAGEWAVAIGYGIVNERQLGKGVGPNTVLRDVKLRVITIQQCKNFFISSRNVIKNTICTSGYGGVGIAGGDSGGPLVVRRNGKDILIGISSFVAKRAWREGYPSAYTRVTSFRNFILRHM